MTAGPATVTGGRAVPGRVVLVATTGVRATGRAGVVPICATAVRTGRPGVVAATVTGGLATATVVGTAARRGVRTVRNCLPMPIRGISTPRCAES